MRKLTAITVAAALAVTSFSAPAFARKHYHDDGYGWHDNGHHRGWYKHKRRHHHRPYEWEEVTVYNVPAYETRRTSEVRCINDVDPLGLIVGGALGGVAGSAIGKGDGRTAAIATGAVIGSLLGNGMVTQRCSEQVFEEAPVGHPISWQAGPGEAYAVVPTRDFETEGRYCREYQAYATVGGRKQQTYGTACMQPDGSWEVIN